ncbi:MAG: phosphoribosylglycinamide formyltransferase [Jatrophihabitans sp.]
MALGKVAAVPARLVVLASGAGTTLQAVLDASRDPSFAANVVAVGSDRPGIGALDRAAAVDVPTFTVAFADFTDRGEWNRAFEQALAEQRPDLVVLAGFMRILDAQVVERFPMINTHPALLPSFPGVGTRAVREALAHGVKLTGVTVHRVDAGVDSGPILAQVAVPVLADDDEHRLFDRIKAAEKPLYVETIRQLCKGFSE